MERKSLQHAFSITGFREGNHEDYTYVYDLYSAKIYSFAYSLLKNVEEAQDKTSDTFTKLWRLHANFESLNNIKAFLYITCRYACLDFLRHLKVERKTHESILRTLRIEEDPDKIDDTEIFMELASLIERLPVKRRKIFELIYYQNQTTSEVAQEMGISNQNVLNQKRTATIYLRTGLIRKSLIPPLDAGSPPSPLSAPSTINN